MKMTCHSPILLSDIKATEGLTLEKLIIHNLRTIVVGRGEEGWKPSRCSDENSHGLQHGQHFPLSMDFHRAGPIEQVYPRFILQ